MTRRELTWEQQVADAGEKAVRNLLLEAAGDDRVELTKKEIAAFRAGVLYALEVAQVAHDDALEELATRASTEYGRTMGADEVPSSSGSKRRPMPPSLVRCL